jgi:hypothetical protein
MLARGESTATDAVNKDFNAGAVVGGAEAHVVGCAFVAEWGWDGLVDGEGRVRKGEFQLRQCRGPFVRAVWHCHQIRRGEVAAAIVRVGSGRYGRGVGGPHRRGRHRSGADVRIGAFGIGAEADEPRQIRTRMWQKNTLRQAECEICAHLFNALQRSDARVRDGTGVFCGCEIAEAEPGIIVAGADDPVEVDFDQTHWKCSISSPRIATHLCIRSS